MKNTLLYTILIFSVNVFGQNQPLSTGHYLPSKNIHHVKDRKDVALKPISKYRIEKNPGLDFQRDLAELFTLLQQYDSVYFWKWDTLLAGWTLSQKSIDITYDAHNNLTYFRGQTWNGSEWVNNSDASSVYDAGNNQIDYVVRVWDGFAWVNNYHNISTYDANNHHASTILQNWNGVSWVNYYQTNSTYDGNNDLITILTQSWDGSAWQNTYLSTYTYDINHNELSNLGQSWNAGEWINSSLSTNIYNVNNKIVSQTGQYWNGASWENTNLYSYAYDANSNLTMELDQYWDGANWVNYGQYIYTYDANNNQINELDQEWNGTSWDNYIQYSNGFDVHNNQINGLVQLWDGSNWVIAQKTLRTWDENDFATSSSSRIFNDIGTSVMNGDSTYFYYHAITGTSDLTPDLSTTILFPNPCNGIFTISNEREINSVEVYNLFGESIYSENNINEKSIKDIDISENEKGIYFVSIRSGTKILAKKIIIQ